MNLQIEKDNFEKYLISKSNLYLGEKNALNEAINYSLLAPGKRIRPLLCIGFSRGVKGNLLHALPSAMAVEMIHAYSLIHDDLPAMDNDDYRRGRLTNHKVYGEAMAILAGDSLLNFAPEFLLKELTNESMDPKKAITLTILLMEASGHKGMVKGQAQDMQSESQSHDWGNNPDASAETLKEIHRHKTGAIIAWSCLAGLHTHDNENLIKKHFASVEKIGQEIGLLFQIVDDVLDATASLKELGKTPGKDQKSGKLTYVNLYGVKKTADMAREIIDNIRRRLGDLKELQGDWSIINEVIASLEQKLFGL